jgi:hypothetical protein
MSERTSRFRPRREVHPSFRARQPFRFWYVSFVFLTVAAVGSGCQSISDADRSAVLSKDSALPVLPSTEEDGDDDEDPHRASDPDRDLPADASEREGRSFLGFPIGKLLDDLVQDENDSDGPPKPKRYPLPDIREPSPDTANFPNSPITLPQGRFYLEASPAFISGPSRGTPATYNAEFLLRYGLNDRVELRLFSNGPTFERGNGASSGFAPLAWDIKTNLWKENTEYHIPAVGLEVFLLTPSGSKRINQGTQPSVNLLLLHTLPFDV